MQELTGDEISKLINKLNNYKYCQWEQSNKEHWDQADFDYDRHLSEKIEEIENKIKGLGHEELIQ